MATAAVPVRGSAGGGGGGGGGDGCCCDAAAPRRWGARAAAAAAVHSAAAMPTAPAPPAWRMSVGAAAAPPGWAPEDAATLTTAAPTYVAARRGRPVGGTDTPGLYQTYRFAPGGNLSYTLPVPAAPAVVAAGGGDGGGAVTVRLHWAEMWPPAAVAGVRVFDVWLGGERVEAGLDVAAVAGGGAAALVRSYRLAGGAGVRAGGGVRLTLVGVRQSPMLAAVEVVVGIPWGRDSHGGSAGDTMAAGGAQSSGGEWRYRQHRDVNPWYADADDGGGGSASGDGASGAVDDAQDASLDSDDDEKDLLLDANDDDEQDSSSDAGDNGDDSPPDAGDDDADDALPDGGNDVEDSPPEVGDAPAAPILPPEHKAHAIIDKLSPAIDRDDDGEEVVELTGYRSHTHAFSEDGAPGRLVATTWFNDETQEQLGTGLSVKAAFPLGSTNIRLEVKDSTGDVSSAYGMVSVTSSVLPGAFCSYYADPPVFPLPLDVRSGPRPVLAKLVTALDFGNAPGARQFSRGPHAPASDHDARWALRCVYLFPAPHDGYYHFAAESDGPTVLTTGRKRVFSRDASGWDTYWSGGWVHLSAGLNEMQVMYASGGGKRLRVVATPAGGGKGVTIGGDRLRHDQDAVVPTVLSVEPSSSASVGGGVVSIYGAGFFTDTTDVAFGGVSATSVTRVSSTLLTAVVPPAVDGGTSEVALTVTTGAAAGDAAGGTSNGVSFYYVPDATAVAFRHDTVKTADGRAPFALPSGISIVMGPDGRYYVGTYVVGVMALTIDAHHTVQSQCTTGSLGDRTTIVGLAFNPADGPDVRLYAATSALFYEMALGLPKSSWNNGKVLLLEPNDECLGVTREVITGLPVSNHDHGTSALDFDQDGNLRFITGGLSNMGTAINAERLGGISETPLSAAMLVAYINRPAFDGAITYSQTEDQDTADQTGGWDVEIFATGIRSAFGACLHTNGEQYVTDNGPNAEFGDASASCTSVVPGGTHGDELLRVQRGGYYGHANRNRGRSHPHECAYRWPDAPGGTGYSPPLLSFDSGSYTGIVEVLSNVFPDLKHDLLVTRFTGGVGGQTGVTKRIRLSAQGARAAFAGDLVDASGVDVTETPHGSYLMPRVQKGELLYVAPVHPPSSRAGGGGEGDGDGEGGGEPGRAPLFIAVKPHRGRAGGGNVVTVGGLALGAAPTATFGGKPCTDVHDVAADGTSFRCTVPPADTPGALVRVVVTTAAGLTSRGRGRGDFWYMN